MLVRLQLRQVCTIERLHLSLVERSERNCPVCRTNRPVTNPSRNLYNKIFGFLMFLSMHTLGFNFLFLLLFLSRVSSVQSGIYFLVGILLFVLPVPCLGIAYLPFSLLLTAVQFFPFFNLYGNKFIMCTSYNVA